MKIAIMFGLLFSMGACTAEVADDESTAEVEQHGGPVNTCFRSYQCGGQGPEYIGQVPGHPTFYEAQQDCQVNACNGHRCTNTRYWCEPN